MSASFKPQDDAKLAEPWITVFLSNRDVSGQVPINFVTRPSVLVTAACFADGRYDAVLFQRCLSDLLVAEFHRLIIDLYWDPGNRQYNLCPVAFPILNTIAATPSSSGAISNTASSTVSSNSGSTIVASHSLTQNSTGTANGTSISTLISSPTVSSSAAVASKTSNTGEVLFELGRYRCDPSLNLPWVASLLLDFFEKTSDTIQARVLFVEINLHAATAANSPDGPATAPHGAALPQSDELVGAQFADVISDYIYPPLLLQTERADLNNSWFNKPKARYPILEFYQTQTLSNGDLSTLDGWPTENYILISGARRVLLNWGRIDPQMQGYDIAGDNNTIFTQSETLVTREVDSNGAGDLISGCYYQEGITDVGRTNNSWASTALTGLFPALINNITACGISPNLNSTLENSTAGQDIAPYKSFVRSAIWNWAAGEPHNRSAPGVDMDDPESQFRCAVLDPTSAYKGHWRVEDCQRHYPAACRVNNQPYVWQISSDHVAYAVGPQICPENTTFDVPRTGLENTYLLHKVLASSSKTNGVWINFNSLDVLQCWVDSGPDGNCPYYEDPQEMMQRQILVPTIGALLVLILTLLTMFVKCNANRRNSRTRKRALGLGSWEYEGVPS